MLSLPHDEPVLQDGEPDPTKQSFVSHLRELRNRILYALACLIVVVLCLMPFANEIYVWLSHPLMVHLPPGASMIATGVASPFLAPFKLTVFVAVLVSLPYLFFQAWAFVAPGLYVNERSLILPLLIASTALFYFGIAFCYYIVFPLVFKFFLAVAPTGVTVMTDIAQYLDFVLGMFYAFGAAFEVPVITYLLVQTGISTVEELRGLRRYVIVGAFVIGAALTPPDVMSQTLLAIPIWLLYEAGLLLCRNIKTQD
jgi:sec-independent protein translocase protein TatC